MENPAKTAPGSGPTVAARARDPETGRFAETDGWGGSSDERDAIARRRAAVERLYPTMTAREIADELGWKPPTISKDVQTLAALGKLEIRRPERAGNILTPSRAYVRTRTAPAKASPSFLRTGKRICVIARAPVRNRTTGASSPARRPEGCSPTGTSGRPRRSHG